MKIKRIIEEEVELDVTYPYYSKNNVYYYKAISDTKMIQVQDAHSGVGILIMNICVELAFSNDCVQITEEEFNKAFFKKIDKLTKSIK